MPGTIKKEWYEKALQNGSPDEIEVWFQQVTNDSSAEICPAYEDELQTEADLFVYAGGRWLEQEDIDRYCALIGCGVRK